MIQLPAEIHAFMDIFINKGYRIYVVGGAVRNLLLGMDVINWDFTTNAKPEELKELFPDSFYNNTFGTVGIKFEGHVLEVTTHRKESDYSDARHPDTIEWAETIEEDLARRDFTINAIALHYIDSKPVLVDPYNGQEDLKQKRIVTVGDPDTRFAEDALRLMRAVRLTAEFGFLLDEKTRDSMRNNATLIIKVSGERIRDELLRIISSNNPAEGVLFLRSTGILEQILPELDACFTIEQKSPKRHHIYDVGTHLVMSLKHCPSKDPVTRLATLLHDIGKVQTYNKDETGLITFHNHEVVGDKLVQKIADRLKLSNKQKEKLVLLVKHHQFTVQEDQTDKAIRRFIRDVTKEYLQDMLDLRTGDRIGSGATPSSWRLDLFKKRLEEVQKHVFSITDLKIDGNDVMKQLNLKPGKQVGEILSKLFTEVEEGRLKNEKEALLSELKKIA